MIFGTDLYGFGNCYDKSRDERLMGINFGLGTGTLILQAQGLMSIEIPIMDCTSLEYRTRGASYISWMSSLTRGENIQTLGITRYFPYNFYATLGAGKRLWDPGLDNEGFEESSRTNVVFYTYGCSFGIGYRKVYSSGFRLGLQIFEIYTPTARMKKHEEFDKASDEAVKIGEKDSSSFVLIMELGFSI